MYLIMGGGGAVDWTYVAMIGVVSTGRGGGRGRWGTCCLCY